MLIRVTTEISFKSTDEYKEMLKFEAEHDMKKYYDCSCYIPYPNENHRFKNGKSKCDRYRPVKFKRNSIYGCVTRCKRVTERG